MKNKRAFAHILLGLLCVLPLSAGPIEDEFRRITEGADSFELRLINPILIEGDDDVLRLAISGSDSVRQWRDSISFDEDVVDSPPVEGEITFRFKCRCIGDYRGVFKRKDEVLLEFTLHHMTHIRTVGLDDGYDVYLRDTAINELLKVEGVKRDWELAQRLSGGPNQPAQHNAGSRPSSADSPASETRSVPAPRG